MKPIKLIMEGFGSYIKRTEIDFTAFGDNALFLITGSTGGGKTTILDAVCFALYGKATGGLRSWEQMRSIGADEDTPTSVDFTFSLGEKKYRFCRSQSIYHGRRDGAIRIKPENACYDLSDGEHLLASGADRSVTLQAQALLGLDCDQFSRVMILPQGEFRRLLLSQSSEKAKLFEKLFDAQQWSKITACAIEKTEQVKEQAQKLQSERLAVLSSCGCESTSQLEEKVVAAQANHSRLQEASKKLDVEFKTKREQADKLKRLDELKISVEKSRTALNNAHKEHKAAQQQFSAAEKECERLAPLREEMKTLRENQHKLDDALKSLAQIAAARRELKTACDTLESTQKQKQTLEEEAQLIRDKISVGEEYIASLRREIEEIPTVMAKLQTLNEISESYRILEDLKQKLLHAEKEAEIISRDYDNAMLELEAIRNSERAVDERLRKKMSVFLSSKLENGKPCPVCGSTVHPQPAVLHGEEEQGLAKKQAELVRLIKEKEAQCSVKLNLKSQKAAASAQLKERLNEQQTKCNGYNIYYKTCQRDIDRQKQTLNELNAKKAKLPSAEKQLTSLKAQLEKSTKASDGLTQKILELETLRAQSQAKIKTLLQYISEENNDEKEVKTSLEKTKQGLSELERLEKKIQDAYASSKSSLEVAAALIDERKSQLEEYERLYLEAEKECDGYINTETAKILAECYDLEHQLRATLSQCGEAKRESESLANSLNHIRAELEKAKKVETLYSNLCHLADILRGSNPMKVPIKMFVLGMMLDDILMQANKYFVILSDGRYKLEKSTQELGGNSLRGLDIEVFDGCYGGTRPVFTLSGGEMFLASLSLAFGLSDVVQGYSGGIRLDSIFIDEGFGSLDGETVETAIKALDRIKQMGRTVGIISHVTQLNEKIGNKIVVTADSTGSHARLVTAQ